VVGWASGDAGGSFCNHEEGGFATTRRVVLQLRGERFYNHEEENSLYQEEVKFIGFQGFREWVE